MADAYLVIAALLALELLAVAVRARRELLGAFEVGRAALGILPVAFAAAAPAALVGGALVELVRAADKRAWRIATALLASAFGAVCAFGVSGGRRVEGLGPALVAGVALASAGLAFALAPALARALRPGPSARGRALVAAGVGAALIAFEAVNAWVLPRLYPAFHLGLGALALLGGAFLAVAWVPDAGGGAREAPSSSRPPSRRDRRGAIARAAVALGLFTASAAGAPAAARRIALAANLRVIYLDHAPVLGRAVELAAAMAPPPPIDEGGALLPEPVSGDAVDLRGRDVVLVTIDALRADHVGAYGYERPTTPSLDRLAREGALFEAAYTPTPHTSYAVTSIMTGKYVRPLLLQGLGEDSETWAQHLRRYGYRTAAFYPPAVFFIDAERFAPFRDRALDFEYRKVEFASAAARAEQVKAYLGRLGPDRRVFLWVHLFEPHEPYEAHPEHAFGDRDVDRYDAEIAAADAGLGAVVEAVRAARPGAVVIATADHGEEFREHGGRYHGTTVYEEQVRVPLVVSAPGLVPARRIAAPVQLVDLLPTVLAGLSIPRPARVRGADLGPWLAGSAPAGDAARGFAFAETETQTMLAREARRLVCARKIGACALYDVSADPAETRDLAPTSSAQFAAMRDELRAVEASHGRFEVRGLRAEGKGWPDALRRGIAGDGDAAADVAALLDDADVAIRRKAGEVLFELRRPEAAAPLRLALVRDEDEEVRRWCALALTRLGEGAPRARELVDDPDPRWRRMAALALAEQGDDRGEDVLLAWWREGWPDPRTKGGPPRPKPIPFERAREIADALARIKSKSAVVPLIDALDDVRLRPHLARALAAIGRDEARPFLAARLATERYQTARVAIAAALVKLGAGPELVVPLTRLLGTPDPLPDGLGIALDADVLDLVGGPRRRELERLRRFAKSGVAVGMVVPKPRKGAPPPAGVRVICRARSLDGRPGEVRFGPRTAKSALSAKPDRESLVPRAAPELDAEHALTLAIPAGDPARPEQPVEVFATLPEAMRVKPGEHHDFVVYATQNVEVSACAVVPLSEEIPPPPPEPWTPSGAEAQTTEEPGSGQGGGGQ